MAITINITDGTTSVDLSLGTDAWNEDYAPQNGGIDSAAVVETQTVVFVGGNSAIDAAILKLENLFYQAMLWRKFRKGTRVYLQVNIDGVNTWRSELLDGQILATSEFIKAERALGTRNATVTLQRANWWEGAEAQIPLTNGNGTNNTSGLSVLNCNDGTGSSPNKKNNYIAIPGANVGGDLPAETRLEVTNTYVSAAELFWVWIGQNWTDPANFQSILEAESASPIAAGGSITASASASGGNYVALPVTTVETDMLTWSLNATFLNACRGNYYKALIKFATGNSNAYKYRLKITWNTATIWTSGQVQPDPNFVQCIHDLVTFRLPPWLPSLTGLDGVQLVLTLQSTSGNQTAAVDYLQLMPTDGWRHLAYAGYGCETNKRIIDDGINDFLYQDDGANALRAGVIVGYGNAIKLLPGKDQRIHIVQHSANANIAEIDRSVSVKLFYRPRRLSL